MSCFDPVTTSAFSSVVPALSSVDFATMLDTLAALQPLMASTSSIMMTSPHHSIMTSPHHSIMTSPHHSIMTSPHHSIMTSSSSSSEIRQNFDRLPQPQPLSLPPLPLLPLSSMGLTSPTDSSAFMSFSPVRLNLPTINTEHVHGYNPIGVPGLSPLPLLQMGFVPPLPESSGLSSLSSLSPMPNQMRRQSAPEGQLLLRPMQSHERRRYSDFSVDALLNRPMPSMMPLLEQRRNSNGRKQRTIYGARQTEVLEEAFHSQKYMVGTERETLASRLGLSEAQVRVWFQNRRSKQRKQTRQDEEQQSTSRREDL